MELIPYDDCTEDDLIFRCQRNAVIKLLRRHRIIRSLEDQKYIDHKRLARALEKDLKPKLVNKAFVQVSKFCMQDAEEYNILEIYNKEYQKGLNVLISKH